MNIDSYPFHQVDFLERELEMTRRKDGSIVLFNPSPVNNWEKNVVAPLLRYAEYQPETTWLAQKKNDTWQHLSYGKGAHQVCAIAQWFLNHRNHGRSIMILSGNSVHHGVMMYAAMLAGCPVVPMSEAYSLLAYDYRHLRRCFELMNPGFIYVEDGQEFLPALASLPLRDQTILFSEHGPSLSSMNRVSFQEAVRTTITSAVVRRIEETSFDETAKFMFTSGSTGDPKAVTISHGMICYNTAQTIKVGKLPKKPIFLDWLPWSHAFAGNGNLNSCLFRGGTYYIDHGKPQPEKFKITIQNLKEIGPTEYLNVPVGYSMLIDALATDRVLTYIFFNNIKRLVYGGATLSDHAISKLQQLAIRCTGKRVVLTSGYGATEACALAASVFWNSSHHHLIGLPIPQVALKLVPYRDHYELRIKGKQIFKAYHQNAKLTQDAFDDEGFYCLGDIVNFVEPRRPREGLKVYGRLKEDFKLAQGSWVNAGLIRNRCLEILAPLIETLIVVGMNRPFLSLIVWGKKSELGLEKEIVKRLEVYNKENPASTTKIQRLMIAKMPLSLEKGEITPKGSINVNKTISNREILVDYLYQNPVPADITVIESANKVKER